jgi:hypothetical protein
MTAHTPLFARAQALAAAGVLLWARTRLVRYATRWRPTDSPFATASTTATLVGRR